MSACASPIAHETLVELWAGELPEEEAERVETHLFRCDACAGAFERLAALVAEMREVIPPVITRELRERLVARGMRLLITTVEPGGHAVARFAPDIDLMVHVLRADLAGAKRVDLDFVSRAGETLSTIEHVPFDVARGEVMIACQRHYEWMFPESAEPRMRLRAVEGEPPRILGEYTVVHVWR